MRAQFKETDKDQMVFVHSFMVFVPLCKWKKLQHQQAAQLYRPAGTAGMQTQTRTMKDKVSAALHCGVSLPSSCTCPCCLLQLPEAIHLQLLHMTSAELCQPLLLFPRPAAHVLCARAPGAVMIAVRARLPAW